MASRKLTDAEVVELRRVGDDYSLSDLADKFGISPQHTSNILMWRNRCEAGGRVGDRVIKKVRRLVVGGASIQMWADKLGVSHETVRRWVRGRARRDAGGPLIPDGPLPSRIADEIVREARERVAAGETHREVADDIGVTIQAVHAWTSGVTRVEAGGPIKEAAP